MNVLEITLYRAPLGLRFTDSASGTLVADGLVVTAWLAGDPGSARQAALSPVSATLGFGRLPGLARYEEARTDDLATFSWPTPGPGLPFEVRVTDPLGRYLPELLALTLPQPALVTPALYSAPARPAPGGFATVSGEVHSAATAEPAAWAVVQVDTGSASYTTLADQLGRYLVYLPYPEALPPLGGSPPTAPPGPLTWPLTISVGYQPSAQDQLADATTADPPELGSLLGQAPAAISAGGATQPSLAATLTFGTALLVMLEVLPA
jgi:hypothetical protein